MRKNGVQDMNIQLLQEYVDAALAEIREAGILNESPVKLRML